MEVDTSPQTMRETPPALQDSQQSTLGRSLNAPEPAPRTSSASYFHFNSSSFLMFLSAVLVAVCAILAYFGYTGRVTTVGVDLGTTFSVVGVNINNKVTPNPNPNPNPHPNAHPNPISAANPSKSLQQTRYKSLLTTTGTRFSHQWFTTVPTDR